ncbi:MAG: exonuclease subunit SbcD [Armatimonadota bacterium]
MNTPETTLTPKCAGAYRILHTADWHLGKQLMDQERHADHQRFLEHFLSVVKEHFVDAVVIAGDVFDGVNPPAKSEELYYSTLATLHSLGIAAVIVSGNHDSPTMLKSASTIIGKLGHHIITDVPITEDGYAPHIVFLPDSESPRIAIAAVPYMREGDLRKVELDEDASIVRDRVRSGWRDLYSAAANTIASLAPDIPAIATGHLTVTGGETNKDTEREIRIGGVGDVDLNAFPDRFGYVALGHLHRPQSFPRGAENGGYIRYSGSPIALGFSEGSHQKAFQIIDVEPIGTLKFSTLPITGNRCLLQLRGTIQELEAQIEALDQPRSDELQPWVELVLTSDETFQSADSLSASLKKLVTAKGYAPVGGVQRDLPDGAVSSSAERTTDELLSELDIIRENEYDTIEHLMERLMPRSDNPAEFDALLTLLRTDILEPRSNG